MLTVADYVLAIDQIAPFSTALTWDNVGLLVGSGEKPVRQALLALDVTSAVIEEASRIGADLIITHHPIIFQPLKKLNGDNLVYRLVREDIAVISAHTNLDMAEHGVNDCLARCLGLSNLRPLNIQSSQPYIKLTVAVPVDQSEQVYHAMADAGAGTLDTYSHSAFLVEGEGRFKPNFGSSPVIGEVGKLERVREKRLEMLIAPDRVAAVVKAMCAAHPYEVPAYDLLETYAVKANLSLGVVGELPKEYTPELFAHFVKKQLNAPGVRYNDTHKTINTVAVCGGSGMDNADHAKKAGAQALVSAEAKHHQWLAATEAGMMLVDAGHYHTEAAVMSSLLDQLQEVFPDASVILSQVCTDYVNFI